MGQLEELDFILWEHGESLKGFDQTVMRSELFWKEFSGSCVEDSL